MERAKMGMEVVRAIISKVAVAQVSREKALHRQ